MNKAASLHPAVVIASVTIAGTAFGVLGTLLAAPSMAVAGVLVDALRFRRLQKSERHPAGESEGAG